MTFVVKHARKAELAVFQSSDFNGEPRSWKIDELVRSAATGGPSAILDLQTKDARGNSYSSQAAYSRRSNAIGISSRAARHPAGRSTRCKRNG